MALSGGAWAQIHSKPLFLYRLPLRRIGPKQDAVHLEGAVPVTAGVVYHEGFGVEAADRPGAGTAIFRVAVSLYVPRMKRLFLVVVAVAVLAVSACGGDAEPQPPATAPSQPEVIEPATTAAVAVSTTAGEPSPLRAEAELAVAARLAADAPRSATDEQIACVASATVEALDEERLSEIVAALDGPSAAVLPAGIVSDLERDRIVDAAAGCLPWTQNILDSLQDLPDVPAAVVECAQAAAPSVETDRLAADLALFGGEFVTVLNLVLPPDCLPQIGGSQADTPSESSNSHANTQVMALLNELLSTRRFHDTIQRQIVDCMAASGFEYAPERYYQQTTIIGQKYGITDIVQASTTGYGPSGSLEKPQPNAGLEGLSESERSAWAIAFFGTGKESIELDSGDVLGIRIGGCLDEAESAVYGSRVTRGATIGRLQDILLRSWHESSVDARVQAAFAEWRACMADRGLPSNDFDGPRELAARNPDREIEIATVDAQCNAEANLGEIWFEVDAASQKRLLTEDEALVLAAADLLDQLAGG